VFHSEDRGIRGGELTWMELMMPSGLVCGSCIVLLAVEMRGGGWYFPRHNVSPKSILADTLVEWFSWNLRSSHSLVIFRTMPT